MYGRERWLKYFSNLRRTEKYRIEGGLMTGKHEGELYGTRPTTIFHRTKAGRERCEVPASDDNVNA